MNTTTNALSSTAFRDRLEALRLIGIIRAPDPHTASDHVARLVHGAVSVVEVSLSTPGALEAIGRSARDHAEDAIVGVGTVLTVEELHASVDAGARFVVTPTTDAAVLAAAVERQVPIVPGAATPSEVHRAVAGGAAAVKLFPASLWSVGAFQDLRTVFPAVAFVPTGGISVASAPDWIAAGAVAVGLGSALTSADTDVAGLLRDLASAR
jgi:2-dehydro-3-deoxyphosphogluconate aldolase / (4S)-4-hydroxy-2-oxoglutarate aldolase